MALFNRETGQPISEEMPPKPASTPQGLSQAEMLSSEQAVQYHLMLMQLSNTSKDLTDIMTFTKQSLKQMQDQTGKHTEQSLKIQEQMKDMMLSILVKADRMTASNKELQDQIQVQAQRICTEAAANTALSIDSYVSTILKQRIEDFNEETSRITWQLGKAAEDVKGVRRSKKLLIASLCTNVLLLIGILAYILIRTVFKI